VRQRLESSVRDHLVSDVPVGVFLSGGVDSSAITALGSRLYGGRLKTYSVGFDFDRGVNELPKARMVAERFGTDHQEFYIAGANVPDVIERLVRSHDEPFADAANVPLYLLCDQLAGSIKVILQGDGGDEIFAGYRRYNTLSLEPFWRWAGTLAVRLDSLRPRNITIDRAMRFLRLMSSPDPVLRQALFLTPATLETPPTRVLSDEMRSQVDRFDPFARYREIHGRISHLDPVQRMLYTDTSILLPDTYLEKVDKSTMAHGIEVRVPFLANRLTEYVLGLPSSMKVRWGQKKLILRKALRGIVPDAILDGPKTGFGVPYGYWLRGPLSEYMRSVLLDDSNAAADLFDRKAVEVVVDEHVAGTHNHQFLLYKLLNLALWRRFYLG
jgi:asparagine synthase (glutamine-hydrolysing)